MSDRKKQELLKELSEIENRERLERDKARFEDIVTFLDNADVFLRFVDHSRTTCSDENISNGHTTSGRGGAFRCDRCGMLNAAFEWRDNRDWLIDTKSAEEIESFLAFNFRGIDLHIG